MISTERASVGWNKMSDKRKGPHNILYNLKVVWNNQLKNNHTQNCTLANNVSFSKIMHTYVYFKRVKNIKIHFYFIYSTVQMCAHERNAGQQR